MRTLASVLCIILAGTVAFAQQKGKTGGGGDAEHGRYIVERVAQCIQCHTPRNEAGDLLMSRELQGAPIPFTSPFRGEVWANTAPPIAGLPQYSFEGGVKLLMTGISRSGGPLRPPMPPFRMNEKDARDVISFLKSMK